MRIARIIISALMAASVSLPAMADDEYYEYAPVLSVRPQIERINNPRQECRTDYVRESYSNDRSPAGAIIGGIAGGLLGSRVGKGKGRVASAAVGAGVGAIVGDRIDNDQGSNQSYGTRPVEHCVTVDNWQSVNRGYLVTYRYHDRDYTTVTDNYPGNNVRLHVAVSDGERYGEQGRFLEPVIVGQAYPMPYGRPHWDRGHGWGDHEYGHRHHEHDDDD